MFHLYHFVIGRSLLNIGLMLKVARLLSGREGFLEQRCSIGNGSDMLSMLVEQIIRAG
jgi:hypothetical protein